MLQNVCISSLKSLNLAVSRQACPKLLIEVQANAMVYARAIIHQTYPTSLYISSEQTIIKGKQDSPRTRHHHPKSRLSSQLRFKHHRVPVSSTRERERECVSPFCGNRSSCGTEIEKLGRQYDNNAPKKEKAKQNLRKEEQTRAHAHMTALSQGIKIHRGEVIVPLIKSGITKSTAAAQNSKSKRPLPRSGSPAEAHVYRLIVSHSHSCGPFDPPGPPIIGPG